MQLGQLFAGVIEEGLRIYGDVPTTPAASEPQMTSESAPGGRTDGEPVVITGAALGLPGVDQVFDDANIGRILAGQQFIHTLPESARARMADMHITRLVKSESGAASFETIDDPAEVIKLAGRRAPLDIVEQFAVESARDEALDNTTRLAIGAGFDALRDAGVPLVMRYKTTTLGTQLPDRWGLPDALRDDTGVIFASAFPGYDRFAEDIEAYTADRARREHLLALEGARAGMDANEAATGEIDRLIADLRAELEANPYHFDRRFLFRVLSMGHSQFAEIIGARGPNTQINAACASTTQALSLAEDWIRAGRCRRVIVVSADDATGDSLQPWITSGFLASGAAATDEHVEDAATPFDRRRHGMIVGMGAAALVVESASAARAWPPADLRGAGGRHRQLGVPRHPSRRRAHRRGDGSRRAPSRGARYRTISDRRRGDVHVTRDLHTGPGWFGLGRDQCPAPRLRPRRRPRGDHQHQGIHRSRHGSWDRRRRGGEGARDRHRSSRTELPGTGPRSRHAEPVHRRIPPGSVRLAARGRLRLAGRNGTLAVDAGRQWHTARPRWTRIRVPHHRSRRLAAMARRPHRTRRLTPRARSPSASHRRHRRTDLVGS